MKKLYALFAILALAACDTSTTPVVSDFNGDSVKVQVSEFADTSKTRETTMREADRICARAGRNAEYASERVLTNAYVREYLYLCIED